MQFVTLRVTQGLRYQVDWRSAQVTFSPLSDSLWGTKASKALGSGFRLNFVRPFAVEKRFCGSGND